MEVIGLQATLDAIDRELEHKQKQAEIGVRNAGRTYQRDLQRDRRLPVDTGQYRANMRTQLVRNGARPYAIIGNPMPQSCRLEFGFDGMTDRLGRTFHQKPRPHWGPVLKENEEKYFETIRAELDRP